MSSLGIIIGHVCLERGGGGGLDGACCVKRCYYGSAAAVITVGLGRSAPVTSGEGEQGLWTEANGGKTTPSSCPRCPRISFQRENTGHLSALAQHDTST